MRAGLRRGAARHAGDLHAKILGDTKFDGAGSDAALHLRSAVAEADRADRGDLEGGGDVCGMDDTATVRILYELSDRQVPAGAEQDDGDGVDIGGGAGAAHGVQLAPDAEAGVGAGGGGGGAKCVVVVHCGGAARVHLQRHVWEGVERVLLEGLSEPLELCSAFACICRHAMVTQFTYLSLLLFLFLFSPQVSLVA